MTPFAAYIVAEEVHASGVLAVVIAGLLLGHKAPILQTAQSRIAERMNWRTIAFLLENTVFLLIGLQAALDLRATSRDSDLAPAGSSLVCAATAGRRWWCCGMVWVFPARYLLVRPGPGPRPGGVPPWTLHVRARLGRHARRRHAGRGVRHPRRTPSTARCCC